MTKQELLKDLGDNTYVALKPSAIHGIGVFALRDIPKGTKDIFSAGVGEWIRISFDEVNQLPEHSRQLIETYCLYDEEAYFVPDYGFKMIDLVLYLNHSSSPNIASINDGQFFVALEDIRAGAELLVNYGDIVAVEGYD